MREKAERPETSLITVRTREESAKEKEE